MTLPTAELTLPDMAPSDRIVVILPRELVEALTALARRKGLARVAYIRMVLTEHVAATPATEQADEDAPQGVS